MIIVIFEIILTIMGVCILIKQFKADLYEDKLRYMSYIIFLAICVLILGGLS